MAEDRERMCLNIDRRPFALALRTYQDTMRKLSRLPEANRVMLDIARHPSDYCEMVIDPCNEAIVQANADFLDLIVEVKNELTEKEG